MLIMLSSLLCVIFLMEVFSTSSFRTVLIHLMYCFSIVCCIKLYIKQLLQMAIVVSSLFSILQCCFTDIYSYFFIFRIFQDRRICSEILNLILTDMIPQSTASQWFNLKITVVLTGEFETMYFERQNHGIHAVGVIKTSNKYNKQIQ